MKKLLLYLILLLPITAFTQSTFKPDQGSVSFNTQAPYMDLRWFGAGTVNDSVAFKNAFIAMVALGRNTLYIPAGVWTTGNIVVPDNMTIFGDDTTVSVIKLRSNAAAEHLLTVGNNVTIRNLKLDGNPTNLASTTGNNGVYCFSKNNLIIDNVSLVNFQTDGIGVYHANWVTLTNIGVDSVGGHAIQVDGVNHIHLENWDVRGFGKIAAHQAGISIRSDSAVFSSYGILKNLKVNNKFNSDNFGLESGGSVYALKYYTISKCEIKSASTSVVFGGISMSLDSSLITDNNVFVGKLAYGIESLGINLKVVDNHFKNATVRVGSDLQDTSFDGRVAGNDFSFTDTTHFDCVIAIGGLSKKLGTPGPGYYRNFVVENNTIHAENANPSAMITFGFYAGNRGYPQECKIWNNKLYGRPPTSGGYDNRPSAFYFTGFGGYGNSFVGNEGTNISYIAIRDSGIYTTQVFKNNKFPGSVLLGPGVNRTNFPNLTYFGNITDTTKNQNIVVDQIIDVAKAYGVVADGSTDNATALMQMRSDLAGNANLHYSIYFPVGTVLSSNNRWIYGLLNADIYGSKTIFRNIYSGSDEKFQRPLWGGDFFQTNVLAYTGGATFTTNYRFKTAAAGDSAIICRTIADAANFSAGDQVIIWGFEQAGTGYPPGSRYNEWHYVKSVNTGTGQIVFKESLLNDWDSTWWDVPNQITTGSNSGRPRITKLNRTDWTWPTYLGFHNLNFGAPTGGGTGSGSAAISADHVVYDDVTVEGNFWPGMVRLMDCNKLHCVGNPVNFIGEADKMGGTLNINNSDFTIPMTNGTGFNRISISNSTFDESVGLCPRYLKIVNTTIRGNLYPSASTSPLTNAPASNPIREYEVENLTFTKTSSNTAPNAFQLPGYNTATIAAVIGDSIYFPFTSFTATNANQVYTIEKGITYMAKNDGTKGGLVTNVTFDSAYNSGQGAFVVFGKWNVAPVASEVWKWNLVGNFIDNGRHKNLGNYEPLFSEPSVFKQGNTSRDNIKTAILTTKSFASAGTDNQIDFYGSIIDIQCVVSKVYNGTDAGATISINNASYSGFFSINTKVKGTRYLSEYSSYGAKSGDALDNTKLGIFQTQLHLLFRGSGGNLSDQSPAAMPEVEFIIHYLPLTVLNSSTSALTTYAPLASPIFTGIPTAPTAGLLSNSAQLANTIYVDRAAGTLTNVVNSTGTTTLAQFKTNIIELNPSSLLASATINFPASPNEGDVVILNAGGTIAAGSNVVTTLTLSGNGHTIYGSAFPTTPQGGDTGLWIFHANVGWFRQKY